MSRTQEPNRIAGSGQHSHPVPTVPGVVVEIRDGQHAGTAVWSRDREEDFVFASYDSREVETADRCVLIAGQSPDDVPAGIPYGCDLESPRGLVLAGVDLDDDLSWISEDADILWDSSSETTE